MSVGGPAGEPLLSREGVAGAPPFPDPPALPRGEPDPALELQQWYLVAEGDGAAVAGPEWLLLTGSPGGQRGREGRGTAALRPV